MLLSTLSIPQMDKTLLKTDGKVIKNGLEILASGRQMGESTASFTLLLEVRKQNNRKNFSCYFLRTYKSIFRPFLTLILNGI